MTIREFLSQRLQCKTKTIHYCELSILTRPKHDEASTREGGDNM